MFVQNLSPEQQTMLYHLCDKLVKIDGSIDAREQLMLDVIKAQCSVSVCRSEVPIAELGQMFATRRQQVSLLLELMAIAHADTHYHEEERGLIGQIAAAFGVSNSLREDMENWVNRQFLLTQEAELFMED